MQSPGGESIIRGGPGVVRTSSDVRGILETLWRRKWIILACTVALPLAAYLMASRGEKVYQAAAQIEVRAPKTDANLYTLEYVPEGRTLASTSRLIRTTAIAKLAATKLNPPPANPQSLIGLIQVTADDSSGFLTITATDSDPKRTAEVANAFAAAIEQSRSDNARESASRAIEQLQKNLDELPRSDRTGRTQLSQQLQRQRAIRASQDSAISLIEPAVEPTSPIAPNPGKNATLAGVLGLLLGLALAFLLENLNRKIREDREVEELTGRPLLATVPASAYEPGAHSRDAWEAFQTLRASLTYFNIDRSLSRIVVTSPVKGDGKTTVSVNLAMALASAGRDVILVDADMRNPQVVDRLGITNDYGLGSVLVGDLHLDEALLDMPGLERGRLRVLRAGPPPPNPAELTASGRMQSLLSELGERAEIVVIDTPPILVVSDAMPLMEEASGVVAVCRIGQTTRDALSRLSTVVTAAGGEVLGVVVTGAKRGGLYGYGAEYGNALQTPGQSAEGSDEVLAGDRQ